MLLGLMMAGCAAPGVDDASDADAPVPAASAFERVDVDPEMLQLRGSDSHYKVAGSVNEALASVGYAVTGTVAGWVEGTALLTESPVAGFDREHRALMKIDVTDSFGAQASPASVYVEVRSGTDRVDEAGEQIPLKKGRAYNLMSLDQFREGAPVGARVLVIGDQVPVVPELNPGETVVPADVPDDATVLRTIGQGLWFEDVDGSLVNGKISSEDAFIGDWPGADSGGRGATFDDLLAAVTGA